jgi:hypothetical protein
VAFFVAMPVTSSAVAFRRADAAADHIPAGTLCADAIRASAAAVIPRLPVPVIPALPAAIFPAVVDSTRRLLSESRRRPFTCG